KKHNDVACLMLGKMSHALQKQFESYPPQLLLVELKNMFKNPQAVEIYDLVDDLHSCKQASGKSVSAHVLAHIGKTRMKKLQREGLLESINDESFDKCESCISGKMTKKPFNNNIERATDLLGLIHTDVCGPLRHVSRKEVELQLGKKIKALRSDRGGEYLSQEFKDYLSKNRIV
nr:retrotransposon protein, putative, Ty1-copia subclass [Tanacetum cinerariifolium]